MYPEMFGVVGNPSQEAAYFLTSWMLLGLNTDEDWGVALRSPKDHILKELLGLEDIRVWVSWLSTFLASESLGCL